MKYKDTHPWLDFTLNLKKIPPHIWFDLGECVSKCDHLQRTAMSDELRKNIYNTFLTKGATATTAIEGNTLGEEFVRKIIDDEKPQVQESYQYLAHEVHNVIALFDDIFKKGKMGHCLLFYRLIY